MADRTLITEIGEWLVDQALCEPDIVGMFNAVCYRLYGAGVPLARARVIWPTLHPLFQAETVLWQRDSGSELNQFRHQAERAEEFIASPVYFMTQNNVQSMRRRLVGPEKQLDYPVLEEMAGLGMTDYLTVITGELEGRTSERPIFGLLVAWVSDRAEGFSDDDILALKKIQRRFAMACRTAIQARVSRNIVDTYLGSYAGRQVLDGAIRRGDGKQTQAVVWYSDLRNSTAMAETMPPEAYFQLLNDYYACTAGAVINHGGEVLDFIGDAVLAVFPFNTEEEFPNAAGAATSAVREAEALCKSTNETRLAQDLAPIRIGVGLNAGMVMFGNIGVEQRLTFSVIGPTVNEVTRIESLTRTSGTFSLVTREVAACEPDKWISTGRHKLAGVSQEIELFAPMPEKALHAEKAPGKPSATLSH